MGLQRDNNAFGFLVAILLIQQTAFLSEFNKQVFFLKSLAPERIHSSTQETTVKR